MSEIAGPEQNRVTQPTPIEQSPIESTPRLQLIQRVHALHEPVTKTDGTVQHWWQVGDTIPPYEGGMELNNNVRTAVSEYVRPNLGPFKEKTASKFGEIDDETLENALIHGWGDVLSDDLGGQRREVLLSVGSLVVNKIESSAYQHALKAATPEQLTGLGLSPHQRDIVVQLLDIIPKADPLFTRFLAFGGQTPEPPEAATGATLFMPDSDIPQTTASLFPKESQYLALRLRLIAAAMGGETIPEGGAAPSPEGQFKEYVRVLGSFLGERDAAKAEALHEDIKKRYVALLKTDFPIVLAPPTEGFFKEPYMDPELRLALATPDAIAEEGAMKKAKDVMADSLDTLGVGQFKDQLKDEPIRCAVTLGAHGVNTLFKAVAQEKPATVLYLDEQERQYDNEFYQQVQRFTDAPAVFPDETDLKKNKQIKFMSRMNTMLHEFSHFIYPDGEPEQLRMGTGKAATVIDEVKAESLYRPLVPHILEAQGLPGTREQWAVAMVSSSFQGLKDEAEDSEYFLNNAYAVNRCVETGIITYSQEGTVTITDYDAFYKAMQDQAQEVLGLYQDEAMTEQKTGDWIKAHCQPSEKLRSLIEILKKTDNS
ncbi:MAG: hypothetical protein NUV52_01250 [Candidatus Roizmanbacteria bacterium]|nr:hypothetical protein [Candidatus Roizmanbacteria bacterium]